MSLWYRAEGIPYGYALPTEPGDGYTTEDAETARKAALVRRLNELFDLAIFGGLGSWVGARYSKGHNQAFWTVAGGAAGLALAAIFRHYLDTQ